MSLNKITLIGNVTADPELRATQNGKEIANFSIATNETWKDKDGAKKEKVQFHRVSAFGGVVSVIKNYVKKGSKLYVEGSMEYGSYDKEDGQKVYTATVILSGFNSKLELLGGRPKSDNDSQSQQPEMSQQDKQALDQLADDVPF